MCKRCGYKLPMDWVVNNSTTVDTAYLLSNYSELNRINSLLVQFISWCLLARCSAVQLASFFWFATSLPFNATTYQGGQRLLLEISKKE